MSRIARVRRTVLERHSLLFRLFLAGVLALLSYAHAFAEEAGPKASILFRATFDHGPDADVAAGDKSIYTSPTLERKTSKRGLQGGNVQWQSTGGKHGGVLYFAKPTKQLTYFRGGKNVPYQAKDFRGSVSLWMRLSPREDLPDGYVDPLQITDKKWNDASFFVDFDQEKSRDFRLGAFANYKSWNPSDRKFDEIPVKERPMVVVEKWPFARDRWTHVAFSWSKLNADDEGVVTLYIDGKKQGDIQGSYVFSWQPEDVVIMLGINYIGWIDDLILFDRPMDDWSWAVKKSP